MLEFGPGRLYVEGIEIPVVKIACNYELPKRYADRFLDAAKDIRVSFTDVQVNWPALWRALGTTPHREAKRRARWALRELQRERRGYVARMVKLGAAQDDARGVARHIWCRRRARVR